MDDVANLLALLAVAVVAIVFWLGAGTLIYKWRNRQTRSSTWH